MTLSYKLTSDFGRLPLGEKGLFCVYVYLTITQIQYKTFGTNNIGMNEQTVYLTNNIGTNSFKTTEKMI